MFWNEVCFIENKSSLHTNLKCCDAELLPNFQYINDYFVYQIIIENKA